VATYGWDCPAVSCVVIARPTKNIALYLQLVGRGLRTSPGKEDCIVIDHSGVVDNHGFVDEDIPWTLDSDTDVREKKKEQEQEKQEPKSITCEECGYVFKSQRVCPKCGHEMVRKGKPIPTHKATLKELKRDRKSTIVDKQKFWNECIFKAKHKKLKCGAAAHMYRQRFGVWPKGLELMPKGKYEWNMTADKFIAREVDRHV
jgi:superfamily II DNA or RNA helicase